jgi:hypothetical protein
VILNPSVEWWWSCIGFDDRRLFRQEFELLEGVQQCRLADSEHQQFVARRVRMMAQFPD